MPPKAANNVSRVQVANNNPNQRPNKPNANLHGRAPQGSRNINASAKPYEQRFSENVLKKLYYNKTMDMRKNMCSYKVYREKTTKLLSILNKLQYETWDYKKKILEKWKKETTNLRNASKLNKITNIISIGKIPNLKQQANGSLKPVKWINLQNENIKKTFYALKRVSEIIKKLTLNKNEYTKLQNFLNYSLKNKKTYTTECVNGSVRRKGYIVKTEVINELINKYNAGGITVNNTINILYKHKKKNIGDLHMFLNTVVALTKNNSIINPTPTNTILKNRLNIFNKQVSRTNSGKQELAIKIPNDEKIREFLYLMYKDMVHDKTIASKDEFKNILKLFIIPDNGYDIIKNCTNFDVLTSKNNADKKSKNELDKIFNNTQSNVSVRTSTRTSGRFHNKTKATRSLIRFLIPGEFTKYKKFYILSDIDAKSTLTNYVSELKTRQVPIGEFLITPANLLDPGGLYWNRDGLAPIAEFKKALESESVSKSKIFKFDSTMLDVTINYATGGTGGTRNVLQGHTRIKIIYNPRQGYQILVNNKNILTSTKRSANSPETKLGKFLGDFLLILNTLILQKAYSRIRPVAFGTSDSSAAIIYKFLCDLTNLKPRLIFSNFNSQTRTLKMLGMENVIVKNRVRVRNGRRIVVNREKKRVKRLKPNQNQINLASASSSNNNSNNRINLNKNSNNPINLNKNSNNRINLNNNTNNRG